MNTVIIRGFRYFLFVQSSKMNTVILLFLAAVPCVYGMDSPIIGILSQETFSIDKYFPNETYNSYIAASYVKFVESGGGRVVPIL